MRIAFVLNGCARTIDTPPARRVSELLRFDLGLTGTKTGCDAGDCGACTVLLDGKQHCACLIAAAQISGRVVTTIEGLATTGKLNRLQLAFHRHGAAQCGICTPGMLMAASDLLARNPRPDEAAVLDALGGVLCRCTGYRKIIDAVLDLSGTHSLEPPSGAAVGTRLAKVDGFVKLTGSECFGADTAPADALWLRAVRSPHARARFTLGSFDALKAKYPGLVRVFTAADIPGANCFGIYPTGKDQPVFAEGHVRFRGEAVLALVGDIATITHIDDDELPICWEPLPAVAGTGAALAPGAPMLHADKPDNILITGRVDRGDAASAFAAAAVGVEGTFRTSFVEHAYIEPEAGYARRVGDRIEIVACTQTPYMDRDEIALILGIRPEQVRIVPTAVGGGFGGKLDLSLQPLIATAAWLLRRPVRCIYTRPESMASTTKRHPAAIHARLAADRQGRLVAVDFEGDFNTGAYASWGPTVANRVPVHASGPYLVANVRAVARAIYTNETPAGAFRGFGVPQTAVATETLMDELAEKLVLDPLEFRRRNALRAGSPTATGHVLKASVGLVACLDALHPHWHSAKETTRDFNLRLRHTLLRRGAGLAAMWYGIGNTSISNPSTMRVGLARDGTLTLYSGAVDIGQGSNTILMQICADALGAPVSALRLVAGDTDRTADAGKTSASRQTFISGAAVMRAAQDLRCQILAMVGAREAAAIEFARTAVVVHDRGARHELDLSRLPASNETGDVLTGVGTFDPPTTPLDENGQGVPYATYAFAAQLAIVEVDLGLGTVKVLRVVAAHDVGKAINPTQVEGQIHGGVAQGIGLALMEEYIPGRTENLHDYLIPTIGDVPEIKCLLIEDGEPLGPYGAKGIGEPALIPTAPAILNAIHDATGVRLRHVPATPDRVRAALLAAGKVEAHV
ncbi:MAG TPA: molybdopterin cofactor-binding domain-containing protein [Stellaceae bacterium]|nr:molybdopterin cofactor-binding domain-containing protein [Stellaceae bacterium]